MGNNQLKQARAARCDEFYTQLCDIERELCHYGGCFRDKIVYCNCDGPQSNFVRFFAKNFFDLGLREFVATCYNKAGHGTMIRLYPFDDVLITGQFELKGDGDFRSEECLEQLRRCDIVVTNPPFSLFREFFSTVNAHGKDFLLIGHVNSLTYKEVYSLILEGDCHLGVNFGRGISGFILPRWYDAYGSETRTDGEGNAIVATNQCLWLTSLKHDGLDKSLELTATYHGNEEKYPRYANADAIHIGKTKDIPKDYGGVMGVPVSFLQKYNPEQFELIRFRKGDDGRDLRFEDGHLPFFRILIRNKRPLI